MSSWQDAINLDTSSEEENGTACDDNSYDGVETNESVENFEEEEDEDHEEAADEGTMNRIRRNRAPDQVESVVTLTSSQSLDIVLSDLLRIRNSVSSAADSATTILTQQQNSLSLPSSETAAQSNEWVPPKVESFDQSRLLQSTAAHPNSLAIFERLQQLKSSNMFVSSEKDSRRLDNLLSSWAEKRSHFANSSQNLTKTVSSSLRFLGTAFYEQQLQSNCNDKNTRSNNKTIETQQRHGSALFPLFSSQEPKTASQYELEACQTQLSKATAELESLRARLAVAEKTIIEQQQRSGGTSSSSTGGAGGGGGGVERIPKSFVEAKTTTELLPSIIEGWSMSCHPKVSAFSVQIKFSRAATKQELIVETELQTEDTDQCHSRIFTVLGCSKMSTSVKIGQQLNSSAELREILFASTGASLLPEFAEVQQQELSLQQQQHHDEIDVNGKSSNTLLPLRRNRNDEDEDPEHRQKEDVCSQEEQQRPEEEPSFAGINESQRNEDNQEGDEAEEEVKEEEGMRVLSDNAPREVDESDDRSTASTNDDEGQKDKEDEDLFGSSLF